jgi:predicted nucleic acid-binding protein
VIVLDTNVTLEAARPTPAQRVADWLNENDAALALTTVTLAEILFGIERTREAERARRLTLFFDHMRQRFKGRIFAFDEESALIYGKIMGAVSLNGRPVFIPDGMIAAIVMRHQSVLATRNVRDFAVLGLKVVNPWE